MKQCQFTNNWRNYVMVFFAEKQCWVATPKYKKGQFSKAKHGGREWRSLPLPSSSSFSIYTCLGGRNTRRCFAYLFCMRRIRWKVKEWNDVFLFSLFATLQKKMKKKNMCACRFFNKSRSYLRTFVLVPLRPTCINYVNALLPPPPRSKKGQK